MHDGSLNSLLEALQFYAVVGRANAWLSPEMNTLRPPPGIPGLTSQDLADMEEFLRRLTGEVPENAGAPEETQ